MKATIIKTSSTFLILLTFLFVAVFLIDIRPSKASVDFGLSSGIRGSVFRIATSGLTPSKKVQLKAENDVSFIISHDTPDPGGGYQGYGLVPTQGLDIGTHTITLSYTDGGMIGSTSFEVLAGDPGESTPDWSNSFVFRISSSGTIPADGTTRLSIRTVVLNSQYVPVQGLSPDVSVTGSNNTLTNSATQNLIDYGKFLSTTTAETKTITVSVGGHTFDPIQVTFTAVGGNTSTPSASSTESTTPTSTSTVSVSPTPSSVPTQNSVGGVQGIINKIKDYAENNKTVTNTLNGTALVSSALATAIPFALNLPLLAPFARVFGWFLGLFSIFKRRKSWGKVYDTESKQPIPLAAVRIFDADEKRILETQLTDNLGRFGFLVKPGKYYIEVVKTDYLFPSKVERSGYHQEIISTGEEKLVAAEIPIDPNISKLAGRIHLLSTIQTIFNYISLPLLIAGMFLAILIYLDDKTIYNALVLALYLLIWLLEIYRLYQVKPYGIVMEKMSKGPIGLAIIRVFSQDNKKLIATKVSSLNGKYHILVNPGNYNIKSVKDGFDQVEISNISFRRENVLNKDILMNKK